MSVFKIIYQKMKIVLYSGIILFFSGCSPTKEKEKEDNKILIPKNSFSVSGFDKTMDSIKTSSSKNDSAILLPIIREDNRLNKNYFIGGIHFLIVDENNSYYVINSLERLMTCGNEPPFSKQDSIWFIKENSKKIENIKSIKTSEITKILEENKNAIVHTWNNLPLTISFALKNDTLNGSTMYDIISFMEKNKMYMYTIRRMNEAELNKIK